MSKRTRGNRAAILAMTVVLAAALSACGAGTNDSAAANTGAGASNEAALPPVDPAGETVADPNAELQGSGTYEGQMDPHSVEITTELGPTAFQLGADMSELVESLEEGDNVTFSYTEEVVDAADGTKLRTLTGIERANGETSAGGGQGDAAALPETKQLSVTLEGMEETRDAKLVQGEGFGLYMFEQFDWDAASGTMSMKVDEGYKVRIDKLAPDTKLEDLRTEAEKELSEHGEVQERKGEDIAEPLRDARLFLSAATDKLTREVIVTEAGGTLYRFTVDMPSGEPSEGFEPLAYASLASLVDLT